MVRNWHICSCRRITTQICLNKGNQNICRMNSTATTNIECCTLGFDHILATNSLSWLERVSLIECRRTSTRCGIGRMSVFVVIMLFLSEAQIAAALTCYCIECTIGIECTGDQCYAQVVSGHVSVTTEHTVTCFT